MTASFVNPEAIKKLFEQEQKTISDKMLSTEKVEIECVEGPVGSPADPLFPNAGCTGSVIKGIRGVGDQEPTPAPQGIKGFIKYGDVEQEALDKLRKDLMCQDDNLFFGIDVDADFYIDYVNAIKKHIP